ncbi:MAG: cytochrome biosis protein CycH [Akkermansiaceae bacterium]|nr:cytochrome biosis protein CycH [Akkermansiaceae bacterium]
MSQTPSEPEWIELETVRRLHSRHLAEHGGATGLRDENLLLSALNRPVSKWSYDQPLPDLCTLAAAYAFGLAKNHPFFDGNKRTAAVVCEVFLILNGLRPTASEEEKYPKYLALASGELEEEIFAAWLRENTAAAE